MRERLVVACASAVVLIVAVALTTSDIPRVTAWGIVGILCVTLIILGVHVGRRNK